MEINIEGERWEERERERGRRCKEMVAWETGVELGGEGDRQIVK